MKQQWFSMNARFTLGVCLASLLAVVGVESRAAAQDGQGKYITETAVRLTKLINTANAAGYTVADIAALRSAAVTVFATSAAIGLLAVTAGFLLRRRMASGAV